MNNSTKTLGILLARGGSKGLAGKHLLDLLGRPVIAYTFEHARAARTLTHVVVTSDCPNILAFARRSGFDAIGRPPRLATDSASVQDTMLHALRTVEARDGIAFDSFVTLYGNVPVRPVGVIDATVNHLHASGGDSVRTFCPVGKWHPGWMSKLAGDRVEAMRPGSVHRRQDLEPLFLHDGACVAVTRASMLRGVSAPTDPHAFFGTDRRGIHVDAGETVEVDARRDLYWAEAVLRDRVAREGRAA